jgi:CheY-like chemotaxis protein
MAKFKNVLLVEDDPITVMVCDRIIRNSDFADDVMTCENGADAIAYIKQLLSSGTLPELIFLDINMPVMNGWDFLTEFEAFDHGSKVLPRVFVLSSTVDPDDFKKAEKFHRVENVISKPLTKEVLDNIL